MNRRTFTKSTALATSFGILSNKTKIFKSFADNERKFKIALNPGIIGVKASLSEAVDYAIKYGYEAVSPYPNEVMTYSSGQLDDLLGKMKEHNISWDSQNIPVEYRRSKAKFNEDYKGLRKYVETMEKQGASRLNTWIIPSSNELTYNENMKQHAYRLGECCEVMRDHGVSLAVEYLGQRTSITRGKYPFIGSLKEGQELLGEIGTTNVGFVLDSFHWYCANDNGDDIRTLKAEDVLLVDLNDARDGFTRVTQMDGKRELPLATGVINIKEFLQAIIDIGFDGPMRTEPFNQVLNDMDNEAALQTNMVSIKKALALVGM